MSRTLQPGDLLSQRYRVERELGRGAMGVVYLARDLRHGRRVAVKVLEPLAVSAGTPGRFLDEIRTAAGLNHPCILAVHDSGEIGGRLFYVTPWVEGESLRERLDRQGPLPVDEALRMGRLLAGALGHAHARGVVHRDIKPDNILLDRGGHPYLADFGVALSVRVEDDARRTSEGVAVGSPLYMSPEQAFGDRDVDGRSDIYALGCVLFEMLAGEPPFPGQTHQAVRARQLVDDPPSLRRRRADVPPWLDAALRKAMARAPEGRYPTGRAFEGALVEGAAAGARVGLPAVIRRPSAVAAAFALAAASVLVLALWDDDGGLLGRGPPALDTLRYAVLPLRTEGGSAARLGVDLALHDALGRWEDLEVVDRLQVGDGLARLTGPLSGESALRLARQLGAGRYLHGSAIELGDSVHVEVVLLDATRQGRTVARGSSRLPSAGQQLDSLAADLVESVLFGRGDRDRADRLSVGGTRSVAARRSYGLGHDALRAWDLSRADSLFRRAVEADPGFAPAHLWVAQVADWRGVAGSEWEHHAQRAMRSSDLPPRERLLAGGLLHLAREEYPEACRTYEALRRRDERDFAGWYGSGQCRALDRRVVRDPGSPSGWSFRSSYHEAVEAYTRAFEELPSSHRGFRAGAFERIREVLFTRTDDFRTGRSTPEEAYFFGWPAWEADTLATVPYPAEEASRPATHGAALVHQRQLFHSIARSWTNAFPRSPDAVLALAVSLEMLGDPAALEMLLRARTLLDADRPPLQFTAAEVWLRLKHGTPDRLAEMERAKALADSLLAIVSPADPDDARILAALAALVGQGAESARLARMAADEVPAAVHAASTALEAYAALGGPVDSIRALESQVEGLIRNGVPASEAAMARHDYLERPATLAYPVHVFALLRERAVFRSPAARAQARILEGDPTGALTALMEPRREAAGRRAAPPHIHVASSDVLLGEARLFTELGDTAMAVAWLDAALDALPWIQPGMLEQPARAGALVSAMALRAELGARAGDAASARRWADAVRILWSDGDEAVWPVLARMERIAGAALSGALPSGEEGFSH